MYTYNRVISICIDLPKIKLFVFVFVFVTTLCNLRKKISLCSLYNVLSLYIHRQV